MLIEYDAHAGEEIVSGVWTKKQEVFQIYVWDAWDENGKLRDNPVRRIDEYEKTRE